MTEKEIITALDACISGKCWECVRKDNGIKTFGFCRISLMKEAKAEIERLGKYNTDVAHRHYDDGIKDFAEKLKKYHYKASSNWSGITTTSKVVDVYVIDNLVKEMVGGSDVL